MRNRNVFSLYLYLLRVWIGYTIFLRFLCFLFPTTAETRRKSFFQKKGQEAKEIFFELGGIYIKVGQFLSNMFHILPEEFVWELQDLQDNVPAHPFSAINSRWRDQFGKNVTDLFSFVDPIAHASASTAQVHLGVFEGKKVAIKTLYPGIQEQAQKDLRIISRIIRIFDTCIFRISAQEVIFQLNQLIEEELDLRNELNHILEFQSLFSQERDYLVPKPLVTFCSENTLVTEYVDGRKMYEMDHADSGNDKNPYLQKLIRSYILMIFEYNVFHADPHPGNLIFLETGEICFVDFGAVQRLSKREVKILEKILIGAMKKDYRLVTDSLFELGAVEKNFPKDKLVQIIEYSITKLDKIISNTKHYRNISWEALNPKEDLRFLKEIQVGLRVLFRSLVLPPNFLSMQRILALLLGNAAYMDPSRSLFEYAERPFSEIVLRGSSFRKFWLNEKEDIYQKLVSLPKELSSFLQTFSRNSLRSSQTEPSFGNQNKSPILGIAGVCFFFFGDFYSEKLWKEPSLLFFVFSGVCFYLFCEGLIRQFNKKG